MNWETQMVINFLTRDQDTYETLRGIDGETIEHYTRFREQGPEDLYRTFDLNRGDWDNVNWSTVATTLAV